MIAAAFEEIDRDYAIAIAERANRHMAQHGVTPTPNNFAVWFDYSCNTKPELKRTIDILIAGKRRFDAATNRELFSTYLAPGSGGATVSDVPEQLQSVMAEAQRYVTQAIADNHTQIKAIGDVAERAESGIDPRPLVECLMDELTKAAARASKTRDQSQRDLARTGRHPRIPEQGRAARQYRHAHQPSQSPGLG